MSGLLNNKRPRQKKIDQKENRAPKKQKRNVQQSMIERLKRVRNPANVPKANMVKIKRLIPLKKMTKVHVVIVPKIERLKRFGKYWRRFIESKYILVYVSVVLFKGTFLKNASVIRVVLKIIVFQMVFSIQL